VTQREWAFFVLGLTLLLVVLGTLWIWRASKPGNAQDAYIAILHKQLDDAIGRKNQVVNLTYDSVQKIAELTAEIERLKGLHLIRAREYISQEMLANTYLDEKEVIQHAAANAKNVLTKHIFDRCEVRRFTDRSAQTEVVEVCLTVRAMEEEAIVKGSHSAR
jgi:hypothetical protein